MTIPKKASSIKKGDYIVIRGRPCKVIEVRVSKTGKHGHAKYCISFVDSVTEMRSEGIFSSNDDIEIYSNDKLNFIV
jgi:translation initiation factor 5A